MVSSIGLNLESSEDNDEDSEKKEKTNWALIFMLLKNRGFKHEEILNLSYPQFNAYMKEINNPLTYSITIPYMGESEDEKEELTSKEELLSIVASMNKDFM